MIPKVSLRLKLSDFINSNIEEQVMEKINTVHNKLHTTVLLYLWFDEDEISGTDLKKFLMRWEDKLTFKTVVKQSSKLQFKDFVFFDIIPINIPDNVSKRFSYRYGKPNKILDGLEEFYKVVKFTTSEKPIKRQKRNDYED